MQGSWDVGDRGKPAAPLHPGGQPERRKGPKPNGFDPYFIDVVSVRFPPYCGSLATCMTSVPAEISGEMTVSSTPVAV